MTLWFWLALWAGCVVAAGGICAITGRVRMGLALGLFLGVIGVALAVLEVATTPRDQFPRRS